MNRDGFEKLSENKQKIIEEAYMAVYNKEIMPGDFFSICRKTLSEAEYAALFPDPQQQRRYHAKEYQMKPIYNSQHYPPSGPGTPAPAPQAQAAFQMPTVQQPQQYQSKPQPQQQQQPQRDEIKSEHIEDIMQYSGVNLKEEAERIAKEVEYNISAPTHNDIDTSNTIDSLFSGGLFREFIAKLCAVRKVRISDEGLHLIFMAVKRKLLDLAHKMDEISKVRVEADLGGYDFRIENETSKQLWYLNEMEKLKLDKLSLKPEEDSKKRRIIQEREDLLIKKRQSNSIAMAALGLKQKSWMSTSSSGYSEGETKFSTLYTPFDERGFNERLKNRRITMRDFLFVLERDHRYNKSIFLRQRYHKFS